MKTKKKNIKAEMRRSVATEVETLLLNMYEKNRDMLGCCCSERNKASDTHGTIMPRMQKII
jgi:hypothetical protein